MDGWMDTVSYGSSLAFQVWSVNFQLQGIKAAAKQIVSKSFSFVWSSFWPSRYFSGQEQKQPEIFDLFGLTPPVSISLRQDFLMNGNAFIYRIFYSYIFKCGLHQRPHPAHPTHEIMKQHKDQTSTPGTPCLTRCD